MIKFEKIYTLTAKNLHNLCTFRIIKISLVLRYIYIISKDQKWFMFNVNNYIN